MNNSPIVGPDVKFGSNALLMVDWIDTTNFVAVGGRGVAKSTVIIARRSLRCIRQMPGAPLAIVADTYTNLTNNIMPAVENGWKLQGLIEGVHYVRGKRPPEEWRQRCSIIVLDYGYCYSFWNGSVLFLGSLDSPSLLAGKSVAHLFFDEAKFASDARAARVMPILRGDAITYGRNHLYGGVTITTDMPDVTEGEYDWFFRYASEMDPERIVKIIQTAGELNRQLKKMVKVNSEPVPNETKIARIEKRIEYFREGLLKLRKGQTFFTNMSSFVNIDVLTLDYARRMQEGALEHHEFLKSVLGMRPGVRREARFYILFDESHKYADGTASGVAAYNSTELLYLNPDAPIDGGMDFGNMLSLVIGQEDGNVYRVHKNIYVLTPDWFPELAAQFLQFFAGHKCKVLNLFYDRSGNNYERQGEDYARKIKEAIEKTPDGKRTGWVVNLMSRGQANLTQNDEYDFMRELMRGENSKLPRLLVDSLNCPELISSMELARAEITRRGETKIVAKVKRSEKLPLKKLPKLSTNFSDAFKYLMMRNPWRKIVKGMSVTISSGADAAVRKFIAARESKA